MQPFEQIVAEHGALVLRVCRGMLSRADADDAWSETFLSALRAYPDLRPDSNVRGWLVTIAHRKAIDQIRRTNRAPIPRDVLPEQVALVPSPDETDEALMAALHALPAKQRGAVVHRYLADLAYRDIAELLECSEAAARRSAADGIAALRQIARERAPR
jgi:RNA polymerase sigma factor (sigma-70 family)